MKKIYLAPHTEAIQLLGENAIMIGSGDPKFIPTGNAETGAYGD